MYSRQNEDRAEPSHRPGAQRFAAASAPPHSHRGM